MPRAPKSIKDTRSTVSFEPSLTTPAKSTQSFKVIFLRGYRERKYLLAISADTCDTDCMRNLIWKQERLSSHMACHPFTSFTQLCIHISAQSQLSPFFIHKWTTDKMPLPTHMTLNPSGTALVMKFWAGSEKVYACLCASWWARAQVTKVAKNRVTGKHFTRNELKTKW